MNSTLLKTTRLFGMAGWAALLLAGCGASSTSDPSPTGAKATGPRNQQTLTIHIAHMCERLKLM